MHAGGYGILLGACTHSRWDPSPKLKKKNKMWKDQEYVLSAKGYAYLKGSIWLTRGGGVNRQLTILAFLYQIKLCIKVGCLDMQLGEQPI